MLIRINKLISRSGAASRREADRLIEAGRVSVNGEIIQALGEKVDDARDRVEIDGRPIRVKVETSYLMLNKPVGFIVTMKDPQNRPSITDLLPAHDLGVVPVGRLDYDSEGLLLLTNDGELAHRLMHPRFKVTKKYRVRIKGRPEHKMLRRLEKGVILDGRKTAPAKIIRLRSGTRTTEVAVEIHEGRKREIRRMFDVIGHPVLTLKRVSFGELPLGRLRSGQWRRLTRDEISALKRLVGLKSANL